MRFRLPWPLVDDVKVQRNFEAVVESLNDVGGVLFWGTATPEGAVVAPVGALFLRRDGGASTTLYVKESGVGSTGWVAK